MTLYAWRRRHSNAEWTRVKYSLVTLRAIHDDLARGEYQGVNAIHPQNNSTLFFVHWNDHSKDDAEVLVQEYKKRCHVRHAACDRNRDGEERKRICPHEGIVLHALGLLKISTNTSGHPRGDPGWYYIEGEIVDKLSPGAAVEPIIGALQESAPPLDVHGDATRRRSLFPQRPPAQPRPLVPDALQGVPALLHFDKNGDYAGASLQFPDILDSRVPRIIAQIQEQLPDHAPERAELGVTGETAARAVIFLFHVQGRQEVTRDQILEAIHEGYSQQREMRDAWNQMRRNRTFNDILAAHGLATFSRVSDAGEMGRYAI